MRPKIRIETVQPSAVPYTVTASGTGLAGRLDTFSRIEQAEEWLEKAWQEGYEDLRITITQSVIVYKGPRYVRGKVEEHD